MIRGIRFLPILTRATAPPARLVRTCRTRSARTALATGSIAFVAATLGLTTALETGMPEWRDPEYGHRLIALRRLERDCPGRPLVVILGTSRAQNAFEPDSLLPDGGPGSPRAFNFGQSASPPVKVLLTLHRLLDDGIRPAAVVVEVLPFWLATDASAEVQLNKSSPRLSAHDLSHIAPYADDVREIHRRWIGARIRSWYTHRLVLMSHFCPRWLAWGTRIDVQWTDMRSNGFIPFPQHLTTAANRAKATEHARREHMGAFGGFELSPVSIRIVRDLVALCRAEGIAIALVEPPVAPMFRALFHPGVWERGDEQLAALANELGVEFFPTEYKLVDEDFIDGHHMLQQAADRYSDWFGQSRLAPWLERRGVWR